MNNQNSNFIFTTVCIGGFGLDKDRMQFKGENHYFEVANILVHSVLKHSNAKIIVVTDIPDLFVKNDRVIVYNINDLTDEPLLFHGYFNYHLKRIAMKKAFEHPEKYSIYLDCDVFLGDNVSELVFNHLDSIDADVVGRFGASTIRGLLETGVAEAKLKIQEFGPEWKDEYLEASLPNETFFIFKKNFEKQDLFLKTWDRIAIESLKIDRAIYADSYYIGASVLNAEMEILNVDYGSHEEIVKFKYLLRIIHRENVNTADFLTIEPYNYKKLLEDLK